MIQSQMIEIGLCLHHSLQSVPKVIRFKKKDKNDPDYNELALLGPVSLLRIIFRSVSRVNRCNVNEPNL